MADFSLDVRLSGCMLAQRAALPTACPRSTCAGCVQEMPLVPRGQVHGRSGALRAKGGYSCLSAAIL